jgi:SPP1 gp7 family putative phage head morphogenesis protein
VSFIAGLRCVPASEFRSFPRKQRKRLFSVPSIESVPVVEAVKREVIRTLEEGDTIRTFTFNVESVLARFGLPALENKAAADLFHQYSMLEYSHVNRQGMMDKAVLAVMPYWQFRSAGDGAVCARCASMDLFTAKWDDKTWEHLFPPIERKCRCTVIALAKNEIPEGSDAPGMDRLPQLIRDFISATGD